MFKNYKYEVLSENERNNELQLLIPGLEDDSDTSYIEGTQLELHTSQTFKEQVIDIAKNVHGYMYKQLIQLLSLSTIVCDELELFYRIINCNPTIRHRFYINSHDNIFGSFNRLHEFIHHTVIKVFKNEKSVHIIFTRDDTTLEVRADKEMTGHLTSLYYKIEFNDTINLKLGETYMIFTGTFVLIRGNVFILSDSTKVVTSEIGFLLEIYG